jgi:hypothetical protein
MPQATGTFETTWDEQVYDESDGVRLHRATVDKVFRGDLDGTAVVQVLRALGRVPDSAGYVAIERVTATLHGRAGTFVLQHNGTMSGGSFGLTVNVVPDTGTGELEGLSGGMTITNDAGKHSYTFDYALGS